MTVTIPKGSTGNREYTANWEANTYKVTYDANGGIASTMEDVVTYDSNFTLATAERLGYEFVCWQYNGEEFEGGKWNLATPITLVAKWNPIKYNISYNLNGGECENLAIYTVEDAITLNNPTKTGYTFTGWTGTDLTEKTVTVTIEKGSIEDRSYTANWQANTYTITYDANGGIASKTEDTVMYDADFTLAVIDKAVEGYCFDGWYDSDGNKYTDGVWKIDKNVTFTAKWNIELEYTLSDNSYSVTGINVTKDNYTILSTYNGKPVTSIESNAFEGCYSLTSIEIPNSVTSIGRGAFKGCYSLTSITIPFVGTTKDGTGSDRFDDIFGSLIPSSLKTVKITGGTSIGNTAFYDCVHLTSIAIPDSVTSIGNSAFYNCNSLTSVVIGNSVTSIGERAFYNCKSLTSIEIPDSVTSMGNYAFYDCNSLTSVSIGNRVTSLGSHAFSNCSSLTSVSIGNSVATIGESAFDSCSKLTSIEIPDSVTSIGNNAFYYCDSLTSIEIPDSVTSIGSYAFDLCDSLTSIEIPDSVTSLGSHAFDYCRKLTIYCKVASKPSGWASAWNDFDRPVVWDCKNNNIADDGYIYGITVDGINYAIKDGEAKVAGTNASGDKVIQSSITYNSTAYAVTSIGDYAFENCSSLTSIEIPDSVTSIGWSAFYDCDSLTSIEIPNSVTSIGERAFSYCTSLTSIEIPDSVTRIGVYAFYNCSSLTSIEIPNSVTRIGENAFYDCDKLTIYCEVTSKPSGWHSNWNYSNRPVVWGYKG